MAESFTRYVASGNTQVFSVPFKFLDRSHISVSLDGEPLSYPVAWASSNQIDLRDRPTAGTVVEIRRTTPDEPLVTFTSGNLDPEDLNVASLQAIFIAQEAKDRAEDNLGRGAGSEFDAGGKRIGNLGAGLAGGDAVNLEQVRELIREAPLSGADGGAGLAALRNDVDFLGREAQRLEAEKANIGGTLADHGITDAYTRIQVDALLADLDTGGTGAAPETGSSILTKLKEVDGAGSGLDAEFLGGSRASAFLAASAKGAANGVASLGADGKVPSGQLPAQVAQPKVFTPFQFGGVGDGVADDSAAVQKCFDAVRTLALQPAYKHPNLNIPMSIDLGGGDWRIVTGINATNIVAWNLEIRGGLLRGHCVGKPILDLVNSRGFNMRSVGFYGERTARPSCAYQTARATPGGFCDNNSWTEITTSGWFSRTAIHCYAHESAKHTHCKYWNADPNGRAAIWEGFSGNPFTSDYSTVMSGGTSFINNKVDTCLFGYAPVGGFDLFAPTAITASANPTITFGQDHNFQVGEKLCSFQLGGLEDLNPDILTVTASTARTITVSGISTVGRTYTGGGFIIRNAKNPPVLLSRAAQFNFSCCYMVAWGTPHFQAEFPDAGYPTLVQMDWDLLFEGSGNTCCVIFNTGNKACSIQGLRFRTYQAHPKFSIFGISTDANARLGLYSADLESAYQFSNAPWFSIPGKFSISGGRVLTPRASLFPETQMGGFNGTITDIETGATRAVGLAGIPAQASGTWSPQLRGSNGAGVADYSATGTWERSGNLVFLSANWTINSVGGASGALQITNLPFGRSSPSSNYVGRDGQGIAIVGNGGTANPTLVTLPRTDLSPALVTGAGYMSGTQTVAG